MEIREIGEDELPTVVEIARLAQPREFASVDGFVDWRNQAAEMVWLLAERGGSAVGAAYALTGWHTPPHRAIGAALVAPERRGRGVGGSLVDSLERWTAARGITELEGPVAEDDDPSLRWTAARGYTEIGRNSRLVLDLTATDVPEQRPPDGIELVTWAERPELARGLWEVAREATPDIQARRRTMSARSRSGSPGTCRA